MTDEYNEHVKMGCPILTHARIIAVGDNLMAPCREHKCAWWVDDMCTVRAIGKHLSWLEDISGILMDGYSTADNTILVERMPNRQGE